MRADGVVFNERPIIPGKHRSANTAHSVLTVLGVVDVIVVVVVFEVRGPWGRWLCAGGGGVVFTRDTT